MYLCVWVCHFVVRQTPSSLYIQEGPSASVYLQCPPQSGHTIHSAGILKTPCEWSLHKQTVSVVPVQKWKRKSVGKPSSFSQYHLLNLPRFCPLPESELHPLVFSCLLWFKVPREKQEENF